MTPASHTGCDVNVCIQVVGTKLVVTRWATELLKNYGCVYGVFFRNDNIKYTGPWICPDPPDSEGVYWTVRPGAPWTYPDGTWLCNSYHDEVSLLPWYPCAQIHD
jgi:hypothetical protein